MSNDLGFIWKEMLMQLDIGNKMTGEMSCREMKIENKKPNLSTNIDWD